MGISDGATETIEGALTRRHFASQDDRPPHLGEVDLTHLDPLLRCLLFTDGTVTRTLEVQALAPVSVEVVAQEETRTPDDVADQLYVPAGLESVRRRVVIGAGPEMPVMWAESHLVPGRLPADFLGVLGRAPEGIGQSLQQVQLESWREMLWFGLDTLPEWSGAARPGSAALTRLYRVISGGAPALLIAESFAVVRRDGAYRLDWFQ